MTATRGLLLATLWTLAACGGGMATDEPLASIPIDVDEDLVEPVPLRIEWSAAPPVEEDEPLIPGHAPALDTSAVYVPYDTSLRALDVASGALRWEVHLSRRISFAPVAVPDGVAVATEDGWLFLDREGRVLARVPLALSPADAAWIGSRLIVVGEGRIAGLRAPGDAEGAGVAWSLEGPAAAVVGDPTGRRALVSGSPTGLLSIDARDGTRRWERPELSSAGVRVAVDHRRAFLVGDDTRIRALDLEDGDDSWSSRETGVRVAAAPVALDGVLWVAGLDAGLRGYDAGGGSQWFRLPLSGRPYIDLATWGRWVVASPQYGPWTLVRGPLRSAGPTNPGSPRSLTINSGADLELGVATGPPGVAAIDARGRVRLLRPPERARQGGDSSGP